MYLEKSLWPGAHCIALPCLAAHVHGQACIIRRLPFLVFGKPRGYYIWIVIEHSSMEVSLVNDHLRIEFEPLNTVSLKRYFEVYVNWWANVNNAQLPGQPQPPSHQDIPRSGLNLETYHKRADLELSI